MSDRVTKLEQVLKTKLPDNVKILPTENVEDYIKNTLVLNCTIEDYTKYNLDRHAYITAKKKEILSAVERTDPVEFILAEKFASILFSLEYLERKYPNTLLVTGESSLTNRFIIELEYTKTLLINQLTFIGNALVLKGETVDELLSFKRSRLPVHPTPTQTRRKKQTLSSIAGETVKAAQSKKGG